MNSNELKEAMMAEEPIICSGIEYKCISAIIYRKSGSGILIQVELMDKTLNSVSIASPNRIERK